MGVAQKNQRAGGTVRERSFWNTFPSSEIENRLFIKSSPARVAKHLQLARKVFQTRVLGRAVPRKNRLGLQQDSGACLESVFRV